MAKPPQQFDLYLQILSTQPQPRLPLEYLLLASYNMSAFKLHQSTSCDSYCRGHAISLICCCLLQGKVGGKPYSERMLGQVICMTRWLQEQRAILGLSDKGTAHANLRFCSADIALYQQVPGLRCKLYGSFWPVLSCAS